MARRAGKHRNDGTMALLYSYQFVLMRQKALLDESSAQAGDAKRLLQEAANSVSEQLKTALRLIAGLGDEREKTVLTLRYINGFDWEAVAKTMHYQRTRIFDIHNMAIKKIMEADSERI